jgi:hypothetical protein
VIKIDCNRTGYMRELHTIKIVRWLQEQGYKRGRDYCYDWNFHILSFWAEPGKEEMETLLAMYWIGK